MFQCASLNVITNTNKMRGLQVEVTINGVGERVRCTTIEPPSLLTAVGHYGRELTVSWNIAARSCSLLLFFKF